MEMTPQQALEILSKASGQIRASRDEHSVIIQAIEVLKKIINKEEK